MPCWDSGLNKEVRGCSPVLLFTIEAAPTCTHRLLISVCLVRLTVIIKIRYRPAKTAGRRNEFSRYISKAAGGTRLWICGFGSVQEATERLLQLLQTEAAEYYACDLSERIVAVAVTRDKPELHTVTDDSEFFGPEQSKHSGKSQRRSPAFADERAAETQLRWAVR